jgi:hypothetical protein
MMAVTPEVFRQVSLEVVLAGVSMMLMVLTPSKLGYL